MPGPDQDYTTDAGPGSFDNLFGRYHDAVYRQIVLLLGRDASAADDVSQETWLRVSRRLHTFEGRSGFYAWVCRIADNEVKRWWRQHKQPVVVSNDPGHDPRAGFERDDMVHEALRRLPDEFRQTLVLELWEGLSVREIAEAMGLPEGTIKSRLFRARERFKSAWQELGGEE
jgi:RNA polymerase sigma-70 factor, ECF subfamily